MNRKIMVEVTEEELKELDKEKTLDDYVDGLLNYLHKNKADKIVTDVNDFTGQKKGIKYYETQRFRITIFVEDYANPQIKIEVKKGNKND